jgi:hypothetical protein
VRILSLFLLLATLLSAATPTKSDAAIEADLKARIGRSKLASDGIQVKIQGGVATLTGQTSVIQRKGTATRMAKSAGATAVVNKIQISEQARKKAADHLSSARAGTRSEQRTERPAASEPATTAPTAAPVPPGTTAPPPVRRAQVKH